MTIDFASPAIEGSDVNMTCEYTYDDNNGIILTKWLRQTEPDGGVEDIWSCEGNKTNTFKDDPTAGFKGKFNKSFSEKLCTKGHAIKLINVTKEDKGTYWCVVITKDRTGIEYWSEKILDVYGE